MYRDTMRLSLVCWDQAICSKQVERAVEQQQLPKGNTGQFAIVPGDCKSLANVQKFSQVQGAASAQPDSVEYRGPFEFGFGQPLICAKYPYGEQCYRLYIQLMDLRLWGESCCH
ncbi:PREDICTED: uncharacterized protein LOC109155892 [Ipomoea nil]|uniref:uncharacterized protein LOC109155892 n=1 Tax=Ipomoea nil TaxID=35883 RepID=UPI000901EBCE|nr:PREDICTED: uncharacterized protein LOC109155892 [Ipomoea nil]